MVSVRDAAPPFAAASLWGGMYVASKWGFEAIPPVTLAFLRVLVGAAVLYGIVRARTPHRSFTGREWRAFVVLGFWVAVTLVTQFVGTDLTNASQGALLTVLTPVFVLVLGITVLGESLDGRRLVGMALAGVGTVVVLSGRYEFANVLDAPVLGVIALFVASLAWAAFTVYGTPLVRTYSPLETATYATLAAVPMLAVLAAFELVVLEPGTVIPLDAGVMAAILYLGVLSTAAAWYLWYRGVQRAPAGTVAVFFFAQPVVGSALGAVFLGEHLGPAFVTGGVVMGVGVYLVSTTD